MDVDNVNDGKRSLDTRRQAPGGKRKEQRQASLFCPRPCRLITHHTRHASHTHPARSGKKQYQSTHPTLSSGIVPSSAKTYRRSTEELPACKLRRWRTKLLTERLTLAYVPCAFCCVMRGEGQTRKGQDSTQLIRTASTSKSEQTTSGHMCVCVCGVGGCAV